MEDPRPISRTVFMFQAPVVDAAMASNWLVRRGGDRRHVLPHGLNINEKGHKKVPQLPP